MLKVPQILVRPITLVGAAALLVACGQKGPLMFPTDPAARQRFTMIQALKPEWARSKDAPAKPAAAITGTTTPAPTAAPAEAPPRTAPPTEADLVPQSSLSDDQ